jgi:hypothetical protein
MENPFDVKMNREDQGITKQDHDADYEKNCPINDVRFVPTVDNDS